MKKAFLLHVLPNFISLLKSSKASWSPFSSFSDQSEKMLC